MICSKYAMITAVLFQEAFTTKLTASEEYLYSYVSIKVHRLAILITSLTEFCIIA